jgi:hypothetical protein
MYQCVAGIVSGGLSMRARFKVVKWRIIQVNES